MAKVEQVNTTGQITVANLVVLSRLIAKHIKTVPPPILRLFRSVIDARTAARETFQQIVAENPNPEIERSNVSHGYFIDALTEAFHALGGESWNPNCTMDDAAIDANAPNPKDSLDRLLLTNQFTALDLGNTADTDERAEGSDDEATSDGQPRKRPDLVQRRRRQARLGKGKKAKRAGKRKERPQDDIPLERYRIIDDVQAATTLASPEYMMAVCTIMLEWVDLRMYLQDVWRECAYDGLNTAVAAAVSHIAVTMIQRSAAEIFVDFPGYDFYELIMITITRGKPERTEGLFKHTVHAPGGEGKTVQAIFADIKEDVMIHTYHDLIDFIEDAQKTRSNRPTKRMLGEIRDWDPNFNLEQATDEERIRWRRCYTINWLYDLVNAFSSFLVNDNTEGYVLENINWSPTGPWAKYRRVLGLNEFAGFVTSLAMQKPGTKILGRILPHHVFQLQCIVDSLMVSRGWSHSPSKGHKLKPPPPNFRPRRDIDLFLDREHERTGRGFLEAVAVLKDHCITDSMLHQDPGRHGQTGMMLDHFRREFAQCLGTSSLSKDRPGIPIVTDIPPSRFSNTDANGLWEYSPFLCGTGLMEALEFAYLYGVYLWDRFPEPLTILHLHNMLVKKGYLKTPVGLFDALAQLFAQAIFIDGRVPSSNFTNAYNARMRAGSSAGKKGRDARRNAQQGYDYHSTMAVEHNQFFNIQSGLCLLRRHKWNLHTIPDAEIPLRSPLFIARISQTNRTLDPKTQQLRLDDTELVRRARADGLSDDEIMAMGARKGGTSAGRTSTRRFKRPDEAAGRHRLLAYAKAHVMGDVACSQRPLSSLNYVAVACSMMMLFESMEEKLCERRNAVYVQVYETTDTWAASKRVGLVHEAMAGGDEECLELMAEAFEEMRISFMVHVYWEKLPPFEEYVATLNYEELEGVEWDGCPIM
ncbi:uncharacterized protein B0H64DRAFT_427284 [Chaetomium fimeti]|uniref:DUF6604 domain-containing protein n=1 Tax=Chaetomium fimeti TaxID=1854472 RepID=A0AAE0H7S3_9PEZI|nr:hypothetical protein B0H64DRAFT_427284 [Chaetomium fimeti]